MFLTALSGCSSQKASVSQVNSPSASQLNCTAVANRELDQAGALGSVLDSLWLGIPAYATGPKVSQFFVREIQSPTASWPWHSAPITWTAERREISELRILEPEQTQLTVL
jgi:hypothetical protein